MDLKTARLTAERLRELLEYDPQTGAFRRKKTRGGYLAGTAAGHTRADGYVNIGIDGTYHHGHRLAWLYMTGGHPPEEIDHINGTNSDNRFCNLRLATSQQNKANTKARNAYGLKGVDTTPSGKWRARIKCNGRMRDIGVFNTREAASAAYLSEAKKVFGDFARA